jgi:hypothetical protein
MTDMLDRLQSALADRYTIERELGRGGMAIVYLAEDVKHHRPVAIKVLQPELAASADVPKGSRFKRRLRLERRSRRVAGFGGSSRRSAPPATCPKGQLAGASFARLTAEPSR